jgi:hypothetical protein
VANLALPLSGRQTFSSFTIDPQNFLKTSTLGLSPYNITLTVTYRTGGGDVTNVPPGSIKTVNEATIDFSSTSIDPIKKANVIGSLECINVKKTSGGGPEESISEIKANSSAFFAAQDRVVTREDYVARVFSMPAKFGRVEKAFVRKDAINEMALDLHILSKDENGSLAQATPTLKINIQKYLSKYRMLTDAVNILDTDILNIGVDFGVVISPKFNRSEVLAKCLSTMKDMLDITNMQIGQSLVISDFVRALQDIVGVISVYKVDFYNKFGTVDGLTYSTNRIDIQSWVQNGILYCPENAIFEVKNLNKDIMGESK